MKKFLVAFFLLFLSVKIFGQQYSQYNTGTLYDSFENPSQASFTPDTSFRYASNFLIPNFNSNLFIQGNAQVALKSRGYLGVYSNKNLRVGENKYSRVGLSSNIYVAMFKAFTSLDGNQEMGFSIQTRSEGRGNFTDETFLLLQSNQAFPRRDYDNILNNNFETQVYHQFSFSYREKINKRFALGFKLSALLGVQYQKYQVDQSHVTLDRPNDAAYVSMAGKYSINYTSGPFSGRDLLPSFKSPGASISIGSSYRTRDNFIIQANLKDLGFIHWNKRSDVYNFDATAAAPFLSMGRREDNFFNANYQIIHTGGVEKSFMTPTNAKFELSANKTLYYDYYKQLRYSPTIIVSKSLVFPEYVAALVNPVQYKNFSGTLTTSYNNYGILSNGLQFMIKSKNAEFYIGSDRIIQSISLMQASLGSRSAVNSSSSYSGADFFLGFSAKFGSVIEHPLNASSIPIGERKGLFGRLFDRLFNKIDDRN